MGELEDNDMISW